MDSSPSTPDASVADAKAVVADTKASSVAEVPDVAEAKKPTRWYQTKGAKFLFTLLILVVAVFIVTKSIKPEEFEKAFENMSPWWFVASFAVGTLTWVGAAIPMRVFAPIKISFKDALLTQMASSFVGVVAPAGLGSLALSIRFLSKRGMKMAQAVATMILMELSQFLTSFILVIAAILLVGISPDIKVPWDVVGWVALGIVVAAAVVFAVKVTRQWIITQVKSVWERFYPQAVWAFKHPKQLALAMFGATLQTFSFIASFTFALLAFGTNVDFFKVGAAYLVFNTLGSMVPIPGGVGSTEAALTLGMTTIGVSAAVGLTAAVTFRLATFYLQIPVGWVAFEYMQRKKLI
ncbi:lysylphosphatidylglycerol synthase transmembrane domain-containing protein [Actinomyces minihominis]|uniref:lysylphosphatidylglycerol synthase transmembrane domain-containing protein n=1 Tax=Actinomyces minihominis TaxID=2002838 RepID=UPI000C0880E4|nr:lysylphosphatidylglycerol synthase transmembrane domain-containing protein [Actinomyces minihominis]